MNVQYINPFINALINTIQMMMNLEPKPDKPFIKDNMRTVGDITGVIGFAEKRITGSVALSFPREAALLLYGAMTGDEVSEISRDVEDCIGEVANIVAGGAKTELSDKGLSFNISVPSVIVGQNHTIRHKGDMPVVVIPFTIEDTRFTMEITMKIYDE